MIRHIGLVDIVNAKKLLTDIVFFGYFIIIFPVVSYVYFAISMTNWATLSVIIGVAILWGIMMPYPVYWYVRRRIWPLQME